MNRCSQPKTGLSRSYRSTPDEKLLAKIQESNQHNSKLHILDARPMVNAVTNMAFLGGGYESVTFYVNTELEFMGIPNIHIVRDSYAKLRDLCEQHTQDIETKLTTWYSQLEATHWIEYISGIIFSVKKIVDCMTIQKNSVLVHCSDG